MGKVIAKVMLNKYAVGDVDGLISLRARGNDELL
jgi:hypothetical protein